MIIKEYILNIFIKIFNNKYKKINRNETSVNVVAILMADSSNS